jgi:hypothetical protein
MSALGHKRTSHLVRVMSALPSKAEIAGRAQDVRFVPKADMSVRKQTRRQMHSRLCRSDVAVAAT